MLQEKTLYGLTKKEVNYLFTHFNDDVNAIALLLWTRGKANTLEGGVKRALKLKKFIKEQ